MAHPVAIGDYESQVPVQEGLRRIIPSQSGASAGPGVEAVGGALQQLAQSEAANYSLQALSQARTQWTKEMLDRQQAAAPGAPNFTPNLLKDFDTYTKSAIKGAPKMAQQFLTSRLTELGSSLAQEALHFEANARQSHNETVAQNSIDAAGNEVMGNPGVFGPRLAEQQALVGALSVDPEVKDKLNTYASKTLSHSAVMGDINRDPYAAMQNIQNTEKPQGYYANLTPQMRETLMDHADSMLHQRVADAERIHQITKQEHEDIAEGIVKQGILLSQQGKLTPAWVTSHSSLLKPSEMRYLFDEAAGKKVDSDLNVYADLLDRAMAGQDVRSEARQGLTSSQLSKEDFTRLTEISSKERPNWFKRGDDYIKTSGETSQFNFDPARNVTLANMRNDWQDWANKNPSATDEQAEKEYLGIVKRYQLVSADNILSLPVPRYLVGDRSAPNINATKRETVNAYNRGEIDKGELDKQANLLLRWGYAEEALLKKKAEIAKQKAQQ